MRQINPRANTINTRALRIHTPARHTAPARGTVEAIKAMAATVDSLDLAHQVIAMDHHLVDGVAFIGVVEEDLAVHGWATGLH